MNEKEPPPFGWLLARFLHHYPGLYYAPGLWPTRDGVIPWTLFVLLSASIRHLAAADELSRAHAATAAQALAFGAKDPGLKKYLRRLHRTAFPDVL